MTESRIAECIVLDKELRAENFMMFTVLSKELGLTYALKRVSSKKQTFLPDYFDIISAKLSAKSKNSPFFIESFEISEKLCENSANYNSLVAMGKIVRVIIKNAPFLEDCSRIYKTFSLAVKSYKNTNTPEIVNIKWLYDFAKSEGYPVREDFLNTLPDLDYNNFLEIVKTPVLSCAVDKDSAKHLLKLFETWVSLKTDIVLE